MDYALSRLKEKNIRITKPRALIAAFLFPHQEHRQHVVVEDIANHLKSQGHKISLATIYNVLHDFHEAGLLSKITIDSKKMIFDTHTGPHHHIYDEVSGDIIDVPEHSLQLQFDENIKHLKPDTRYNLLIKLNP